MEMQVAALFLAQPFVVVDTLVSAATPSVSCVSIRSPLFGVLCERFFFSFSMVMSLFLFLFHHVVIVLSVLYEFCVVFSEGNEHYSPHKEWERRNENDEVHTAKSKG